MARMRQFVVEQMSARTPRVLEAARRVKKEATRWWQHQRTDAYVLSYPGCGRTWLTVMLGKALVDQYGLDANPARITELADLDRKVPRIEVRHDGSPQLKAPPDLERDKSRFASKAVVLLVRDPRDAVISYYFEATKRRHRFSGTAGEFLRHPIGGLDSLIDYLNIWAAEKSVPKRFSVAAYEDLHADPVTELERIFETFGYVIPRDRLAGAVEYSRFENMRAIEAKGFDRPELDRRDPKDETTFKARKGKVGGYREHLSPSDIEYLEARLRERLSPFYSRYLP